MKFSLQELKKYYQKPLEIQEVLDLKESLMARNKEILDVSKVEVSGFLAPSPKETIAHLQISATLTLPSTRSLKEVALPLNFSVEEVYLTEEQQALAQLDEEDFILLEGNTLDLVAAVEDYLLLAIPSQILTSEEKSGQPLPGGSFWQVMSEEDYEKEKLAKETEIDPRLAKLGDLFKED